MGRFFFKLGCAALVASELLIPSFSATQTQQKEKKKEKSIPRNVLNFDGGILFETDGSVSEITCFRLEGRVTSDHFFDNFKRIDDEFGTQYRRGQEVLTEFPEKLHFFFMIIDFPCPSQLGRSE